MSELIANLKIPLIDILDTCQVVTLPSGDFLYTSDVFEEHEAKGIPFQMYVSLAGQHLIAEGSNLLDLADPSFKKPNPNEQDVFVSTNRDSSLSFVTQEILEFDDGHNEVAVKRIFRKDVGAITGLQQFEAVRLLQNQGVRCPNPFLARRNVYISLFCNPSSEESNQEEFTRYISSLLRIGRNLSHSGLWRWHWELDTDVEDYKFNSSDPELINRFVAIDPVVDRFGDSWRIYGQDTSTFSLLGSPKLATAN